MQRIEQRTDLFEELESLQIPRFDWTTVFFRWKLLSLIAIWNWLSSLGHSRVRLVSNWRTTRQFQAVRKKRAKKR